jgi:replicative DNA helicase
MINHERNIIRAAINRPDFLPEVLKLSESAFLDRFCSYCHRIFTDISKEHEDSLLTEAVLRHYMDDEYSQVEDLLRESIPASEKDNYKFSLYVVKENYKYSLLVELASHLNNNMGKKLDELVKFATTKLDMLEETVDEVESIEDTMNELMLDIQQKASGEKSAYLKTGWEEFDRLLGLEMRKFVLVSAEKKIGKTRWMVALIKTLLQHNDNLAIQWFSFEMAAKELAQLFVCGDLSMTDDELNQKNGLLDEGQVQEARKSTEYWKSHNLEIRGQATTIYGVKHKFRKFCRMNKGKDCILILDNHGYITPHSQDSNRNDDDIARELRSLRDETGGLIFLIHHLTKAAGREQNIDRGYEPRLEDVRGSSRSLDFCNVCILLHRPNFYEDLIKQLELELNEKEIAVIKKLFLVIVALNRSGEAPVKVRLKHKIQYSQFNSF